MLKWMKKTASHEVRGKRGFFLQRKHSISEAKIAHYPPTMTSVMFPLAFTALSVLIPQLSL